MIRFATGRLWAGAVLSCALSVTVGATAFAISGEQSPSSKLDPVDPVAGIIEAFRSHSVVALSDPHGSQQMHEFLLTLVRHPAFPALVNDIVVEPGSARYQPIMDRYIQGEAVEANALREAWRNTTQHQILDHPLFEEFVLAVRTVNAQLPPARRLRVLLGDPPIDWDAVKGPADHREWIQMREWYPAAIVQTEVLAKRRRALLVYGQMHLQRKQVLANYDTEPWQAQTIVSALQRATGAAVFTIWGEGDPARLQPELRSWTKPGLLVLRGTTLGAKDFEDFHDTRQRFKVVNGKFVPVPQEEWRRLRMEEQFDALLYLGPRPAGPDRRPPPTICADSAYMEMRMRRLTLTGAPPPLIEQLRRPCAGATP